MLQAAILTAFFGLLRVSEYTCPENKIHFDTETHLTQQDVSINLTNKVTKIRIKSSKTDPFRIGMVVRIGPTQNALCPVSAMIKYVHTQHRRCGPFFQYQNGVGLTRQHIVMILRHSLQQRAINTHSLRIGGASALASINTPDYIIQIMGRWKSDAYRTYISLSDQFITNTHRTLATTQTTATIWSPKDW